MAVGADPLARFVSRCRAAGLVLTPQRLAVFRHLEAGRGHPSAEELYATVRRELPTLSLATVYKTLEALARVGVVRRVSRAGARGRWDAGQESHHHLVCIVCGSVVDVADARLDAVKDRAATLAGRHGFVPSGHVVEIYGRCAACHGNNRVRSAAGRPRARRNTHGGRERR
jgi:Fur family transcriptional regulator, peroxide stress response regulator